MQTKGKIYKVGKYEGNSLWLTDDTTLVASSKKDVEDNIKILIESGSKYGLKLNKTKTKILHMRGTKNIKEIGVLNNIQMEMILEQFVFVINA